MTVQLLYFDGCPHWETADERLREALRRARRNDRVEYRLVRTAEEAHALGFHGSPTVLVDGADPFPVGGDVGLACRIYRTREGVSGAPTVEQLVEVMT